MHIRVKLFAVLRDRAGVSELPIEVPTGGTVADAAEVLFQHCPALRAFSSKAAYAVNRAYVRQDEKLADGDELAVIPPVSGG